MVLCCCYSFFEIQIRGGFAEQDLNQVRQVDQLSTGEKRDLEQEVPHFILIWNTLFSSCGMPEYSFTRYLILMTHYQN